MSDGVLYVAFGSRFQDEARRSIRSLRRVSALPVAVVTDQPWQGSEQPDQFIIRSPARSFRCKPLHIYEASPFTRTLFVDTDTVFARDIAPVFGLLDHYDIGVRFAGAWLAEDELHFHAQCNSGVILFRASKPTANVFAEWLRLYDAAVAANGPAGDQRYLAIAIARSTARPVHLPSYLHLSLFDTITTDAPPVLYHGRGDWIEAFANKINTTWDRKTDWQTRVWLPNIVGFLPRGMRRSDPLLAAALLLRRIANLARLSGQK